MLSRTAASIKEEAVAIWLPLFLFLWWGGKIGRASLAFFLFRVYNYGRQFVNRKRESAAALLGKRRKEGIGLGTTHRSKRKQKMLGMLGVFCILLGVVLTAEVVYRDSIAEKMGGAVSSNENSDPGSKELSQEPETSLSESSAEAVDSKPQEPDSFSAYREQAIQDMKSMSLSEKVGQVFVFLCPSAGGEKMIETYKPGGICLNAANFQGKTKEQAKEMLEKFQSSSAYPLLTCCDEEGGTVTRISRFPEYRESPFQSPRDVYASGGMEAIGKDTEEKAQLLKSLGINTNLAPVADLSGNPVDFMYARSFGGDPESVSEYIRVSVETYKESGVACVLKHFPGYGNNGDTHIGLAWDKRDYSEFETKDFLPCEAGFEAGAPIVLVNHNIVECMDPEKPATLSPEVHRILREELGFGGLIMTDDLVMKAIPQYTGGENPAPEAFLAGNDLLLCTDIEESYQALLEAVENGKVSEERLEASVLRILEWKYAMNLIQI